MEDTLIPKKVTKEERKLNKDKKKAEKKEKFSNKTKSFATTNFEKKIIKKSNDSVLDIKTPIGSKKDVNRQMPKSYCPIYTEEGWHSWWENQGYFKPEYNKNKSDEKFVIMIPPPNVTGVLHIGHALTLSIEDCIVRWNRMKGKQTLWLPGTDHAGIATQTVVEKKLLREKKLTRHDLGREDFVKEIWKWKNEKGDSIINQLKQMGSSCDFSRLRFTMDESMSKAVTETFIRLYDEKLIYRSNRLVNWSCSLRSAISDIEVDKIEISKRTFLPVPNYDKPIEFGYLVHFAYRIIGTGEKVFVATTRIETMLGDTGIAVHPDDERYKHLHGQFVSHPFVESRRLPIICDSFVEREFGTGVVKITPAHDHNDYEVGKRHGLEFINIFTDAGLVVEGYGEFSNMKRFDVRPVIIERLKQLDLFDKITDNNMIIPVCSKSKDVIEPIIKNQWYVNCTEMAADALRVVQNGQLKLLPEGVHDSVWNRWMEDCHDWCISRQLWWGHRIPMYRVVRPEESGESEEQWIPGRTLEEAKQNLLQQNPTQYSSIDDLPTLEQDPDVLDTWFSSQLFPFATLGWPEETNSDLRDFYPGNLLETGHDILFFWVARMVMIASKMLPGKPLPFNTVYLHAMVRDAHGKKMSKSLGNVLDPLDVINGITLPELHRSLEHGNLDAKELVRAKECQSRDFPSGIPQCGTDALRFALLAYTTQPRDMNLDVLRVSGYRNFCNKIWQAFRFTQMFGLDDQYHLTKDNETIDFEQLSTTDRWILSRLSLAVSEINDAFEGYNFSAATTAIHHFLLYELCDVYIEYSKQFRDNVTRKSIVLRVLYECLEVGLRLLHPMMPFITEELFQRLSKRPSNHEESIMVTEFPKKSDFCHYRSVEIETSVELANEFLRKVRSYRNQVLSIVDKQVLSVDYKIIDREFCDQLLNDLILPLSSCKKTDIAENSRLAIFENEKFELFIQSESKSIPKPSPLEQFFTINMSEEKKNQSKESIKLFSSSDMDQLSEKEAIDVKQWCNWLNAQKLRGKQAMMETLQFLNDHFLRSTFVSMYRYPTLADGFLLNYFHEISGCDQIIANKFPNIDRWRKTINNN